MYVKVVNLQGNNLVWWQIESKMEAWMVMSPSKGLKSELLCGVCVLGKGQSKDGIFVGASWNRTQLVVFKLYHQGLPWSLHVVRVHKYLWNKWVDKWILTPEIVFTSSHTHISLHRQIIAQVGRTGQGRRESLLPRAPWLLPTSPKEHGRGLDCEPSSVLLLCPSRF